LIFVKKLETLISRSSSGRHELAGCACSLHDFVEQVRIYVGANPEAEDARGRTGGVSTTTNRCDRRDNLIFVRLADSRLSVGKEDHDKGTVSGGRSQLQRALERIIDRRATDSA
jgi:hypothetical protein